MLNFEKRKMLIFATAFLGHMNGFFLLIWILFLFCHFLFIHGSSRRSNLECIASMHSIALGSFTICPKYEAAFGNNIYVVRRIFWDWRYQRWEQSARGEYWSVKRLLLFSMKYFPCHKSWRSSQRIRQIPIPGRTREWERERERNIFIWLVTKIA